AGVYDQSTGARRIYVNGVKLAERVDPPITVFNGSANIGIGVDLNSSTTASYSFHGLIDELALYSNALSDAGLQSIYNAGGAGKCTTPTPPSIFLQPANQTVVAEANVTFTVGASGTTPLSYQWKFDGTNLSGATTSALSLSNVQFSQAGIYS